MMDPKYLAVLDWPIPEIHYARGVRVSSKGATAIAGPLPKSHPINETCEGMQMSKKKLTLDEINTLPTGALIISMTAPIPGAYEKRSDGQWIQLDPREVHPSYLVGSTLISTDASGSKIQTVQLGTDE